MDNTFAKKGRIFMGWQKNDNSGVCFEKTKMEQLSSQAFFLPLFCLHAELHTCDLCDKCQTFRGFIGRLSAFHSLIAEALRQIDYAAG